MTKNFQEEFAAMLPESFEIALKGSMSTERANRPMAEEAIRDLYEIHKEKPPLIVWVDSPRMANTFIKIFGDEKYKGKRLPADWKDMVIEDMKKGYAPHIRTYARGQQDFFWRTKSIDDIIKDNKILDHELVQKQFCFLRLSLSCYWNYLFDNVVLLCERPVEIHVNDKGQYHNEKGMALRYSDGTGLYVVHGVSVPARMVTEPLSYTKKEILALNNSEQVRVLGEMMGWDVFIERIGAKVIDTWVSPGPEHREAVSKDVIYEPKALSYILFALEAQFGSIQPRFLKMQSPKLKDDTQPYYIEPVDPGLLTAQAARKWSLLKWEEARAEELVDYCNQLPELIIGIEA